MPQSNTVDIFKVGDIVVYPSHGVGKITGEETQVIAGIEMKLYVISFDKDKMILRVPKTRAEKAGLRHLSSSDDFQKALITLQSKAKVSKGMWSKRAQEYETKINSGNVLAIAEVLRDLHKNIDDPNRSYSEQMIYKSALQRLAHEFAAAANTDTDKASVQILEILDEGKVEQSEAA